MSHYRNGIVIPPGPRRWRLLRPRVCLVHSTSFQLSMDARLEVDEGIHVECVRGVGELFGQHQTRRGQVCRGKTQAPEHHPREHAEEDLPSTVDDLHRAPLAAVPHGVRCRESMEKLGRKLHQPAPQPTCQDPTCAPHRSESVVTPPSL
jgi:hypothetical protein